MVDWLTARTPEFLEGIEYVAIDPAAVYAKAVRTPGLLPNATLVVDHFHLVQLANAAVTKVRRRAGWELKDRRGGKIEPSMGQPEAATDGPGTVVAQNFTRMSNALIDEDRSQQILAAYIGKRSCAPCSRPFGSVEIRI